MIFQLEHIPIRPFGHQQALTQEHQTDESETCGLSSSPIKGGHSQWVGARVNTSNSVLKWFGIFVKSKPYEKPIFRKNLNTT